MARAKAATIHFFIFFFLIEFELSREWSMGIIHCECTRYSIEMNRCVQCEKRNFSTGRAGERELGFSG